MADEVHVGDIGTKYRCRCRDNGSDFDPSAATVKRITFRMSGLKAVGGASVSTLDRDADVEVGVGAEAGQFFLTYTVTASDVADSGFHSTPGSVKLQAYVEFGDGTQYHSDIQTKDTSNALLKVYKNLT